MCQLKIRLELQLFANCLKNHSPEERAPQKVMKAKAMKAMKKRKMV